MALTDILTIPFLISLGITLLLLALVSMFFLQRFNEQNHKFSSMMGLVTTMADELNFIRNRLQMPFSQAQMRAPVQAQGKILVSDDESDEEEEDDSDEEDDEDEDEDEEEEDDSDEDEEEEKNIKIINMSETFDINYENLNNDMDKNELSEKEDVELSELEEDLDDDLDDESKELEDEKDIVTLSANDLLKSVHITDEKKEFEIQDYKKLTLSKLKELVVEKGLVADASKLNKNKLLALLA